MLAAPMRVALLGTALALTCHDFRADAPAPTRACDTALGEKEMCVFVSSATGVRMAWKTATKAPQMPQAFAYLAAGVRGPTVAGGSSAGAR